MTHQYPADPESSHETPITERRGGGSARRFILGRSMMSFRQTKAEREQIARLWLFDPKAKLECFMTGESAE